MKAAELGNVDAVGVALTGPSRATRLSEYETAVALNSLMVEAAIKANDRDRNLD